MAIFDSKTWVGGVNGRCGKWATAAPVRVEPWTLDPSAYAKCAGESGRFAFLGGQAACDIARTEISKRDAGQGRGIRAPLSESSKGPAMCGRWRFSSTITAILTGRWVHLAETIACRTARSCGGASVLGTARAHGILRHRERSIEGFGMEVESFHECLKCHRRRAGKERVWVEAPDLVEARIRGVS
eukprot:scaffold195392_cov18-Prasinocladus_malaysianus.AAC.2